MSARRVRVFRAKAVFQRTRTHVPHVPNENPGFVNHQPSIPKALQSLLRRPLQTAQSSKSQRSKRKTKGHGTKLLDLIQKRISASQTAQVHPIALLAWMSSEEPLNAAWLLENAPLLLDGAADEPDPVMARQIDGIVQRFAQADITDAPISQENPNIEVPKGYEMQMTPLKLTGHEDHDALMTDAERTYQAKDKVAGTRKVKHGFDPVQVLKKHAITLEDPRASTTSTLTTPIHSLFRAENFHECPEHIYEVLKPALRLATLYVTHRATSSYWHSVIFGTRELTMTGVERIRNDTSWSERQARQYRRYLSGLVDFVHFHFSLWPSVKHEGVHVYGSMHPIKDLRLGWLPRPGEACRKSRICLHSDFYTTAKRLQRLKNPDHLMVLRFNFFFAQILSHEMAHFFEMSRNEVTRKDVYTHDGKDIIDHDATPEPFLHDQRFNEAGWAFETKVFGGRIEPISSRMDCLYGLTLSEVDDPMNPHHIRTFYTVPMDYVSKMQQQDTWDQDFADKDWRIFHVPRDGAKAVSVPYFDMTVWKNSEERKQVSDVLDVNEDGNTPWKRTFDHPTKLIKARRGVKANH